MKENRARQIEKLMIDQNLTLAELVARGLINPEEVAPWIEWDHESR